MDMKSSVVIGLSQIQMMESVRGVCEICASASRTWYAQ